MMLTDQNYQELLLYCQGEMDEVSAGGMEARLRDSEELRRELERVRLGQSLMGQLEVSPMPGQRADRVRRQVLSAVASTPVQEQPDRRTENRQSRFTPGRYSAAWLAAAALIVVAVATGLFLQLRQPSVQLRLAQDSAGTLERAAFTIHTGRHSPGPVVNLASSSLSDVQRWISRTAGLQLETDVPPTPSNCCRDVRLRQACKTSVQGCTTLALRYEVDGRPVTLLMADAERLSDSPEPSLWHKNVVFRPADSSGLKTLSWTEGGQTYTLISDLPEYGQKACYLCHLDESTRRKIDDIQLSF